MGCALVLLPGLDGTSVLFRPLIEYLPAEVEPIMVSYPPDVELGYSQLLEHVLATLPARPFVLLGESFSGPLAVMAAATRPVGLRGLILCATFVTCPVPLVPGWTRHLVRPWLFRLYPALGYLRFLLGRAASARLRSLASEALAPVRPAVLAHRVREVVGVDVARLLATYAGQALYLRGGRDWIVPRSAMRAVLRVHPSIECLEVPGPHMVLQSNPEAAAEGIAGFVRRACDV